MKFFNEQVYDLEISLTSNSNKIFKSTTKAVQVRVKPKNGLVRVNWICFLCLDKTQTQVAKPYPVKRSFTEYKRNFNVCLSWWRTQQLRWPSKFTKKSHIFIQIFNSLKGWKMSETKIIGLKLCKVYVFIDLILNVTFGLLWEVHSLDPNKHYCSLRIIWQKQQTAMILHSAESKNFYS